MSKETALIVLGLWVAALTQLGIPGSWKTALLALSGLAVALIGAYMRTQAGRAAGRPAHHPFVENGASASHE